MKYRYFAFVLAILLVPALVASPRAQVRVVASTTDLASIATMIGGDRVKTESIAKGKSDPHFVEILPSYMVKVARANVYLKVGLGLDIWAQQIIDGSRNGKLAIVDCSERILPLQKPTRRVDASMGDVHPLGNPHYWLDPDNGAVIAEQIAETLSAVDPNHAAEYQSNLEAFRRTLEEKRAEWARRFANLRGLEIVTYHDSWPYFCKAFGIKVVGFVEPKPGIEPTPSHTANLVELIKSRGVKVVGVEPYYSMRAPESIARMSGARVVILPPSVGGRRDARDYWSLFDAILGDLVDELDKEGS